MALLELKKQTYVFVYAVRLQCSFYIESNLKYVMRKNISTFLPELKVALLIKLRRNNIKIFCIWFQVKSLVAKEL